MGQLIEIPRISRVDQESGQSDYGKMHLAASLRGKMALYGSFLRRGAPFERGQMAAAIT
jgi:hypothetical protein